MTPAGIFLVIQIRQDGADSFRLAPDTVDAIFISFRRPVETDIFPEQAAGCESVSKITVQNRLRLCSKVFHGTGLPVFKGIEGIQQHSPYESDFRSPVRFAVGGPQADTRIVFEGMAVHVALCEKAGKDCLRLFRRMPDLHWLRSEPVV